MNTPDLHVGDFVERNTNGVIRFGKVNGLDNESSNSRWFNLGDGPNGSTSENVPESQLRKLETKNEQKDAIERQRRQGMLRIAAMMKSVQEDVEWAISEVEGDSNGVEKPNTGIFVVVGIYGGIGMHVPSIAAVSSDPATTPEQLEAKLRGTYPQGFETIPEQAFTADDGGPLVRYKCFELPQNAADLIDWELPRIDCSLESDQ